MAIQIEEFFVVRVRHSRKQQVRASVSGKRPTTEHVRDI
jgi:hypothetical protein